MVTRAEYSQHWTWNIFVMCYNTFEEINKENPVEIKAQQSRPLHVYYILKINSNSVFNIFVLFLFPGYLNFFDYICLIVATKQGIHLSYFCCLRSIAFEFNNSPIKSIPLIRPLLTTLYVYSAPTYQTTPKTDKKSESCLFWR